MKIEYNKKQKKKARKSMKYKSNNKRAFTLAEVLIAKRAREKMSLLNISLARELKAPPRRFLKQFAFTLAEVIITLGIIGVVAALTIPALMQNNQKQVSLSRLKEFYSVMNQAIKMSENDNGSTKDWNYPATAGNGGQTLTWFNTYIAPYMKYNSIDTTTNSAWILVKFNNGSEAIFYRGAQLEIYLYTEGFNKRVSGKNNFSFELITTTDTNAFRPYDVDSIGTDRTKWTNASSPHACSASGDKMYCAGLIMYEGWTIPSDYPFWN